MRRRALSPEGQLLFLAASNANGEHDAGIRRLLSRANVQRLIALAEIERAMPVLAERIRSAGPDADPSSAALIRQHAQVAEFRMRLLQSRLAETLERFHANGVHPILLKGAAVVASVFGDFTRRPMGDVDLLIATEEAPDALTAAREAGWTSELTPGESAIYERHHHLPPLTDAQGTGFALELHTDLFAPGHPFALTAEHVRRRGMESELNGRPVRVPHPADQVLHACIHFAWSHMLRVGAWRTFRDVSALLDGGRVTWSELTELAHATRAESCVYWTLRLGRAVSALSAPGLVLRELSPGLPSAVLAVIERHLLTEILASEPGCPSVRLQRALWSAAIRPRRIGHRAARPWTREGEWEQRISVSGAGDGDADAGRLRRWHRYARALLGPRD